MQAIKQKKYRKGNLLQNHIKRNLEKKHVKEIIRDAGIDDCPIFMLVFVVLLKT